MGRFILSRDASGVRFLLESDKGRALAVSRRYATLDAAKKGICSLVYYAPIVPLIDTAAGERAPNPKFELLEDENGFGYAMKSANGKVVIAAGGFATRKACLRAIAMLRTGVQGADVLFARPAGYTPLTVGAMLHDPVPDADGAAVVAPQYAEAADEPLADFDEAPAAVAEAPAVEAPAVEAPLAKAPAAPRVPRRVVLQGEGVIKPRAVSQKAPEATHRSPAKERGSGILSKFFKR